MTKLLEPNFEKDLVYLYQFPRLANLPCLSPYCVKVEMFLRLYDIKYKVIEIARERSKYGLVPFVELNGEHIADSQLIVEKLKEHFSENFNNKNHLSAKDLACSRMISRSIENHTMQVLFKYKVADDPDQFADQIIQSLKGSKSSPLYNAGSWTVYLVKKVISRALGKRVTSGLHSVLGPFSDAEFEMLLHRDLDALRDFLGSQKFLFGDEPTEADCTLFGHLSTMYYLDMKCHANDVIREEYPTLVEYMSNVMKTVFPEYAKGEQAEEAKEEHAEEQEQDEEEDVVVDTLTVQL